MGKALSTTIPTSQKTEVCKGATFLDNKFTNISELDKLINNLKKDEHNSKLTEDERNIVKAKLGEYYYLIKKESYALSYLRPLVENKEFTGKYKGRACYFLGKIYLEILKNNIKAKSCFIIALELGDFEKKYKIAINDILDNKLKD